MKRRSISYLILNEKPSTKIVGDKLEPIKLKDGKVDANLIFKFESLQIG